MKTQITLAAALFATVAFAVAGSAQAQSYGFSPMLPPVQSQPQTVVIGGGDYGGVGYHSSTAAEGQMRGYADVVRAYGEADLMHSQAANYWEMARGLDIQNDYDYAQTYFAMRELNREARAAEAGPRVTRYEAERISDSRMPERLTRAQYEPVVGQLYWPTALQEAQYDSMRSEMNAMMHARWSGASKASEIQELAETMDTALTSDIHEFTTQEYLAAKRFLVSLRYEVTFPATAGGELVAN